MAIRVAPAGLAQTYAQLSKLAGQAARARQQEIQAQRMASEMQQLQARRELMEFEHQLNLEAQKQAQQWQLEKLRIASLNDFLQQEKELQAERDQLLQKRLLNREQYYATMKAIMDADILSPEEKEEAMLRAQLKFLGYESILPRPSTEKVDPLREAISQMIGGEQPVETPVATGTAAKLPAPKTREEYEALPSGTQYIDPTGTIRIKR